MGTWDQVVGKKAQVSASAQFPGLQMDLHIQIPLTKMLDSLYEQLRLGVVDREFYDAMLEQYSKVIDDYRNRKG